MPGYLFLGSGDAAAIGQSPSFDCTSEIERPLDHWCLFLTYLQGMGFLSHYRRIRKQDGDPVLPEIEFNFGRAFQQLGEC